MRSLMIVMPASGLRIIGSESAELSESFQIFRGNQSFVQEQKQVLKTQIKLHLSQIVTHTMPLTLPHLIA